MAPAAGFLLSMLLCRISRRGSAAVRHLFWLLAFVLMAVSIPITLLHLRVPVPMLPAISAALTPAPGGSLTPMMPSAPSEGPAWDAISPAHVPLIAPARPQPAPALHPPDWPGLLLALWATGFLLSLIPVLAGILRVRRIADRSGTVIDRPVAELWSELCASGGRKQRARLFVSSEVSVPFAAGWLRPAVTLPHGALGWPSDLLRAALIHELAHVTRNDLVSFAFARLVASFYWFHPLVWRGLRALSARRRWRRTMSSS